MEPKSEKKEKSYLDYLDKTFLEELNYKIWSTKGARFNASQRLIKISRLSNLCTSLFSVYLIAVGLLSVYNLYNSTAINENVIAFSVTCLSILLLVFTLIENSRDYNRKSKEYHDCSLELSRIYNRLRIFKTLTNDVTDKKREEFTIQIADAYQDILAKHENHDPIDHQIFKTSKARYHKLNGFDVFIIKIKYYIYTAFIYHLLIILPPVIIAYMIYISKA
ncbi:hypothetical protein AAE02nite_04820 [Adhaeribacter aerolatus]|uniref:SMODS and SLOG-associating 2TM effector domain-containing protein n=1 Tax=Adhaeribacter aerolatus TaxID=670289 RepID=A0A512AT00_9BACT|nr:SLATT domain-containing protein [Adhaeribacter aerolatus]GEO02818.1 hypothetical protein AAE02nite_04820 [Adhaeribacter aerolatus]